MGLATASPSCATRVYNHTFDVTSSLAAQGTPADMVQIGNEINPGMLLPTGSTSNWANLAALLTAGANAAKAANGSTRIMLHLAEGGDNALFRWWFDQAVARGVPFDVIGASYYPYWHGSLAGLQTNLNDMAARYNRDIVVVETAYGFTLAAGRLGAEHLQLLARPGRRVPGHARRARSTRCGRWSTWSATCPTGAASASSTGSRPGPPAPAPAGTRPTPVSGNGWENQALFDYNDRALPGLAALGTA